MRENTEEVLEKKVEDNNAIFPKLAKQYKKYLGLFSTPYEHLRNWYNKKNDKEDGQAK